MTEDEGRATKDPATDGASDAVPIVSEARQKALEMLVSGMSQRAVSQATGIPKSTVAAWAKPPKPVPRPYVTSPLKLGRARRTAADLAEVDQAIIAAAGDEPPVTLRGVFYRAVSAGAVEKTEHGYLLVYRRCLALRRAGRIPYSWITDGTRFVMKPDSYRDIDAMLETAAASYRRALWNDQAVDVHVFAEKDAVSGVLYPVTSQWDVPLGVMRGYASESFVWNVAEALRATRWPSYMYNFGDHDPSGVDIWRNFEQKVRGFAPDADVHFERLAVTPEQIDEYHLPTRPTKSSNHSRGFVGESVEVDALPPNVLRQLVETAITQHIDQHALEMTRVAEQSEREVLQRMRGVWEDDDEGEP